MKFFYEKVNFVSQKNKAVRIETLLGMTRLTIDHVQQSGSAGTYIASMWKEVFFFSVLIKPSPAILVLGLGAGNVIGLLQKRYTGSIITAIEWDETMTEVIKHLKLFKTEGVVMLIGDAVEKIVDLPTRYDLIVIDLFTGGTVEPRLITTDFLNALKVILEADGEIFINVGAEKDILVHYARTFHLEKNIRYRYNTIGLFKKN